MGCELVQEKSTVKYGMILLACILLLALSLRIIGVWFGLPYQYHIDEYLQIERALAVGTGDLNPHMFHYPGHFHLYTFTFLFGLIYGVERLLGIVTCPMEFGAQYWSDPTPFYLVARIHNAFYGVVTVFVLFLLSRRLFKNKKAVYLSTFTLAVSYLHVAHSHYATVDIPQTFFLLLATYFSIRIFQEGSLRNYIFAGIACGIGISVRYPNVFCAVAIFLAHLFSSRRAESKWYRWIFERRIIMAAAICVLAFALTAPYVLIDFEATMADLKFEMHRAGKVSAISQFSGPPIFYSFILLFSHGTGWVLGPLGFYGVFTLLKERWKIGLILLVFPVLYLGLGLARSHSQFPRHVLPLIPVWIIFVIAGTFSVYAKLAKNKTMVSRVLVKGFTVVVGLSVIAMLAQSITFSWVVSRKDTRTMAKEWIEENIPAESNIAVEFYHYCPQFEDRRGQIKANVHQSARGGREDWKKQKASEVLKTFEPNSDYRVVYLYSLEGTLKERIENSGADYLVLSSENFGRYFTAFANKHFREKKRRLEYEEIMSELKLIKTFPACKPDVLPKGEFKHSPEIRIYQVPDKKAL